MITQKFYIFRGNPNFNQIYMGKMVLPNHSKFGHSLPELWLAPKQRIFVFRKMGVKKQKINSIWKYYLESPHKTSSHRTNFSIRRFIKTWDSSHRTIVSLYSTVFGQIKVIKIQFYQIYHDKNDSFISFDTYNYEKWGVCSCLPKFIL